MLNIMQLIVFLPILNLNFPGHVSFFYRILMQISSFEFLPSEYLLSLVFKNFSDADNEETYLIRADY